MGGWTRQVEISDTPVESNEATREHDRNKDGCEFSRRCRGVAVGHSKERGSSAWLGAGRKGLEEIDHPGTGRKKQPQTARKERKEIG